MSETNSDRVMRKCPRCGHEQEGGSNCNACGLAFDKWRGLDTIVEEIEDSSVRDIVVSMWTEIESNFQDGELHAQFLEFCRVSNTLDVAALLYRVWLVEHPEDEIAKQQQGKIVFLAQQHLAAIGEQEKSRSVGSVKIISYIMLAILLGLILWGSWWLLTTVPKMGLK